MSAHFRPEISYQIFPNEIIPWVYCILYCIGLSLLCSVEKGADVYSLGLLLRICNVRFLLL